jgi:hypothetical protein
MLDPFLQRKVTGQAGFDYEIVQTPPEIVVETMVQKYQYDDVTRIQQLHNFYTLQKERRT